MDNRAWALGDIGVGLMAWLNIVAIFMMRDVAFKCLRDYGARKAAGKDPEFDPAALGIAHAALVEKASNCPPEVSTPRVAPGRNLP